jgi:hypothetical protein
MVNFVVGSSKSEATDFGEYCKHLSGKIEYDNPSKDMKEFNGIISLTKDPKAEILTNDNFIMQFSKLKNCKWAIGIVAYSGKHTRVQKNTEFHTRKSNFALIYINKFNYLMILAVLLLSMVQFNNPP